MRQPDYPIYIGTDALHRLVLFCQESGFTRFNLVADTNTYPILGKAVHDRLLAQGWQVQPNLMPGQGLIADESALAQVLLQSGAEERTYVVVGSGTLTDIVRLISHRTRNRFISLPTAPSVDGYTSVSAPLVVGRFKRTYPCHGPCALFADLKTLCEAPSEMIAAGFGDILAKYNALADWKLGELLWGEHYEEEIAQANWRALDRCVSNLDEIEDHSEQGIALLMESLLESGWCMALMGNSHPASGAEHQLAHDWEMLALRAGRPPGLHGVMVGLGLLKVTPLWQKVGALTYQQAQQRLEDFSLAAFQGIQEQIQARYGPAAGGMLQLQAEFLSMDPPRLEALKASILTHWEEIQAIAARVPSPEVLQGWLAQVGGIVDPLRAGLSPLEISEACQYSHWIRDRFTVARLGWFLGLEW